MPTATGYFGYSALNLGPLTTTFTAPSSCATKADHQIYANATSPYLPFVTASSCTRKGYGDCYPSGEKWDTEAKQTTTFVQGAYPYFSPGMACPKGWETVGMMQHGSSSGQFGVSGILTVSTSRMYEDVAYREYLQPTDFWKNVLDRDETMAVCCPTGYVGDSYGFCKSMITPLESHTASPEYCYLIPEYRDDRTIITSVEGFTKTVPLISNLPRTSLSGSTRTELYTVEASWAPELAYGTYVPAVTLVYKEEDVEAKSGDSDGETTATGETTAAETTASGESAAAGIQRSGVVSLFGVTLGLLAGAGMLVAW